MNKNKRSSWQQLTGTIYFKIGATAFLLYLMIHYWSKIEGVLQLFGKALTPLLVGCIIAYIVNILLGFISKHYDKVFKSPLAKKCRQGVCIAISYVLLLVILVAVICLLVPELSDCLSLLVSQSGTALNHLVDFMHSVPGLGKYGDMLQKNFGNSNLSKDIVDKVLNLLRNGNTGWVTNITSVLQKLTDVTATGLVGLFFSFYLLYNKDTLKRQSILLLDTYFKDIKNPLLRVLAVFDEKFHRFIVGQVEDACVLGVMCGIVMLIFGIPYTGMIAVIIAVTALVPIVGALSGAVIGFVLVLSVSFPKAVIFIILFLVVQQVDNNVTYPRIVGGSIGLPGIWVLAAVTIGGSSFGILGMLFFIPIFSSLYYLLQMDMKRRNAKGKIDAQVEPQETIE